MKLQVQLNSRAVKDATATSHPGIMIMSADVQANWIARVPLANGQALLAFPKFGTVGIGFEKEEDWNTNLPCQCSTNEIYNHIAHNKGDKGGTRITKTKCLEAIEALRKVGLEYLGQKYEPSVSQKGR